MNRVHATLLISGALFGLAGCQPYTYVNASGMAYCTTAPNKMVVPDDKWSPYLVPCQPLITPLPPIPDGDHDHDHEHDHTETWHGGAGAAASGGSVSTLVVSHYGSAAGAASDGATTTSVQGPQGGASSAASHGATTVTVGGFTYP